MTIMRMIMTTIMMISTLTTQANLDLKERMAAALEREERARAELQDSKDQVRKENGGGKRTKELALSRAL